MQYYGLNDFPLHVFMPSSPAIRWSWLKQPAPAAFSWLKFFVRVPPAERWLKPTACSWLKYVIKPT